MGGSPSKQNSSVSAPVVSPVKFVNTPSPSSSMGGSTSKHNSSVSAPVVTSVKVSNTPSSSNVSIRTPVIYTSVRQTSCNVILKPNTVVTNTIPVEGKQSVKHSVNNYTISKLKEIDNILGHINLPHNKVIDKFTIRVCSHYNSRDGCNATVCRRFHVCYYWVESNCKRDSCLFDHAFNSFHNQVIIGALSSRRDFNIPMVMEVLQNNHKYNRKSKKNDLPLICMSNIMRKCHRTPCLFVHDNKPYFWQLNVQQSWLSLPRELNSVLEQQFCQPDQERVELPPVPNVKGFWDLRRILSPQIKWEADFQCMKVTSAGKDYDLRRLSTPSDICCLKSMAKLATRWTWYWQNDEGHWNPYIDGCGSKFYLISLSDKLEYNYNFEENSMVAVTIGTHSYVIDTSSLTQLNQETMKVRKVRRRPTFNEPLKDLCFTNFFHMSDEKKLRHCVDKFGTEFAFVKGLLETSMTSVNVLKVERVINNLLWKAYQNKKNQLIALHQGDKSIINEQYLFHGTSHSVVDQICSDNLDWRLFGTNVGNLYGRGVYFSNVARVANSYCKEESRIRVMFVAIVLVGSLAVGQPDMKLPPMNPKTKRYFDTTCNSPVDSQIFVKYNRDEYYPAYIAHYQE